MSTGAKESNPLMTEAGDEEYDQRVQMEFEQSMRDTSTSFFKIAKSTFMSTNEQQSDRQFTESFGNFMTKTQAPRGEEDSDGFDLAADAD